MSTPTLISKIKDPHAKIFRKMYIKRKLLTTGLFESDWLEVSNDVQSWGKVRKEIDFVQYSLVKFSDLMVKMDNSSGRYNPSDDEFSLWSGYGSQQRSLVKIEAGFLHQTKTASGIWSNTTFPSSPAVFQGVISGDIDLSDQNVINIPVRPILQIFRDFPARNLTGWTTTGMTASQFLTMLRDQTDGSSNYIFRPFFGDTTTNWNIPATTNVYTALSTSTAADVFDKTTWDVMVKLAEAENKVLYVKRDGTFNFTDREPTTTVAFEFYGAGFFNSEYGHTIKKINRFGKKQTDYYSRVEIKFVDSDTITSSRVLETAFTVSGSNDAWNFGIKTFQLENFWIAGTLAADTILQDIYNTVTVIRNRIDFTASFVPHLEVLDRVRVNYDSGGVAIGSVWDLQDWAEDATAAPNDLIWSLASGDALNLNNQEFKILSIEIDLDKLETKISGRAA